MQSRRNIGALLLPPKHIPSEAIVREVFHTSGFPDSVLSVQSVKQAFAVRTKVKSIDASCLTYLTTHLYAQNVEVTSTTRGLMFLFS